MTIEEETLRRVGRRLLPFLFLLYILNFLDRSNIGIASLRMNADLDLSVATYGLAAGIFFIGYALFEVPSNLFLVRIGARRWIARIMVSWGLVACAMMFVRTAHQLHGVRFALGIAEAGFVPGIVYYLSRWFPDSHRGRAASRFFIAIPVASAIGGPLGGAILGLDGWLGLHGWQWLFLLEGLPSVFVGLSVLAVLDDRPEDARWLRPESREWLAARLASEGPPPSHGVSALRALGDRRVWRLTLPYFLYLAAAYPASFFAPLWIRATAHTTDLQTGAIVGAIAVVAMVVGLAAAASSDRRGERRLHAAFGLALITLGYLGFALLPHPIARLCALALVQCGAQCLLPAFWAMPGQLLGGTSGAVGIALINSVGNIGGFVSPYLVGSLHDRTGSYTLPLLVLAGVALAGMVAMLSLPFSPRRV